MLIRGKQRVILQRTGGGDVTSQAEIVVMQPQAKEFHQKPEETRMGLSLEPLGGTRLLSTHVIFGCLTY